MARLPRAFADRSSQLFRWEWQEEVEMPSDLQSLHLLVINRIYHEDQLFAQRTYVLTTSHAFLITAFAIFLHSGPLLLSAFLTILGMGLAIFQATYARQANRVIGFWREYAKLIEAKSKIKFDSLQYGFLESGNVV